MKFKFNQKVVALAAAGLVLLSGATVTSLAAWTDTEWVNGGVQTLPGLGTSTFTVQQNVTTDAVSWASHETSPGNVVDFGTTASALTPSTSVYGFVRLRTGANSLGGTLTLLHETTVTGFPFLSALRYGAWLHPDDTTCNATNYNVGATQLVADNSVLTTDSTVPFNLAGSVGGAPGVEQTVCFKITFPALTDPTDKSLQGLTGDPIWQFSATSN